MHEWTGSPHHNYTTTWSRRPTLTTPPLGAGATSTTPPLRAGAHLNYTTTWSWTPPNYTNTTWSRGPPQLHHHLEQGPTSTTPPLGAGLHLTTPTPLGARTHFNYTTTWSWGPPFNPFMDNFIQDFFFPEIFLYLFRKAMKYLATIVDEKAPPLRIIFHPLLVAKQQTTVP